MAFHSSFTLVYVSLVQLVIFIARCKSSLIQLHSDVSPSYTNWYTGHCDIIQSNLLYANQTVSAVGVLNLPQPCTLHNVSFTSVNWHRPIIDHYYFLLFSSLLSVYLSSIYQHFWQCDTVPNRYSCVESTIVERFWSRQTADPLSTPVNQFNSWMEYLRKSLGLRRIC